jgi:hypothetical protein
MILRLLLKKIKSKGCPITCSFVFNNKSCILVLIEFNLHGSGYKLKIFGIGYCILPYSHTRTRYWRQRQNGDESFGHSIKKYKFETKRGV